MLFERDGDVRSRLIARDERDVTTGREPVMSGRRDGGGRLEDRDGRTDFGGMRHVRSSSISALLNTRGRSDDGRG